MRKCSGLGRRIDEEDTHEMIRTLSHRLAKRTYRLTEEMHA